MLWPPFFLWGRDIPGHPMRQLDAHSTRTHAFERWWSLVEEVAHDSNLVSGETG